MVENMILSLTPEALRDIFQEAGYRAEIGTEGANAPVLRSASGGLLFEVRFGTALAGEPQSFADLIFLAGLRRQGELPQELVNGWNNSRRFARLRIVPDLLVLEMDVMLVGGVSRQHLRTQIEVWDRLLQDLVPYLRSNAVPSGVNGNGSQSTEAAPAATQPA